MMATRPVLCWSITTKWCWLSSATMARFLRLSPLISVLRGVQCTTWRPTSCHSSTGDCSSGLIQYNTIEVFNMDLKAESVVSFI